MSDPGALHILRIHGLHLTTDGVLAVPALRRHTEAMIGLGAVDAERLADVIGREHPRGGLDQRRPASVRRALPAPKTASKAAHRPPNTFVHAPRGAVAELTLVMLLSPMSQFFYVRSFSSVRPSARAQ